MRRRTLIIIAVLVFIFLLVGIIFAVRARFGGKGGERRGVTEKAVVTISQSPNSWRLVKHPAFNIDFQLPLAWRITLFENGRGRVEGTFFGEGINAIVNVDRQDNMGGLTPEKLLNQYKNLQASEITRGPVRGVSYIAKAGSEDLPILIKDSYVLVNKYFVDDKILIISCSLSGPNYKSMIPTCEEILKSLSFTQ